MNARERYLAVYDEAKRKTLDRVPTFVQGVKNEFSVQNEDEMFESFDGELFYNTQFDAPYVLGFDSVFAGLPGSFTCDTVEVIDEQGQKQKVGHSGQISRGESTFYNKGMFFSLENLEKVWASVKKIDASNTIEKTIEYYEQISPKIFPVPMIGGIFDTMWMSMGMSNFSKNYRKNTKLYQQVIKFFAEGMLINIEGVINATKGRAGILNILDDVAFKGRTMIPADRWLQDLGPYYKEACSMIADAGMIAQIHTDGDVSELVPAFQKVGFRGLQGWEGGMDPKVTNESFPDFVVVGFGDVGEVLPFGTPDQIDAHVKGLMDALKENRHYIFGPSTVIVKEMPLKNVQLFMQAAQKYGHY
jgi:hypothetical protein